MKTGLRQSMAWLHTWAGLWFCWLLFTIFLTGSLGVFDDAITHWMRGQPSTTAATHFDADARAEALRHAQTLLAERAPQAEFWSIRLPDREDPSLGLGWRLDEDAPFERLVLDPRTGQALERPLHRDTEGGHHFVHMHFELHSGTAGIWVVGVATMAMLVALVSGIVVHKKFFAEFFTFRPHKARRSWLDAHNALSVLTLPFQFMIAYTGLTIFWSLYMPAGIEARYGGDTDRYFAELNQRPEPRPMRALAAPTIALPPVLREAEAALGRPGGFVVVGHPGDASATVRVFGRFDPDTAGDGLVGRGSGRVEFDGVSGQRIDLLRPDEVRGGSVLNVKRVMDALHFGHFGGNPLKWLYFLSGMAGAAMMATGALLFAMKRRKRPGAEFGRATPRIYRLVDILNMASLSGLGIACIAYLWINRLLPLALSARAEWEIRAFFVVWLASLIHAALRPLRPAWREQLAVLAALCLALPLLNGLTTGDHALAALTRGDLAVAGVEAVALAFGLGSLIVRARLTRGNATTVPAHATASVGSR